MSPCVVYRWNTRVSEEREARILGKVRRSDTSHQKYCFEALCEKGRRKCILTLTLPRVTAILDYFDHGLYLSEYLSNIMRVVISHRYRQSQNQQRLVDVQSYIW
jgi:UTP-glucose-1-phosphate uridylyltransferase